MTSLRSPLKLAQGRGSAHSGTRHFIIQRLTALALVGLGIWFVVLVLRVLGAGYGDARALLARPWNAVLMISFVIAMFWHAQLGLQVIVEDYVHTPWREAALQVAIKFLCFLAAVAAVLAVLRVALGGVSP